MEKRAINMLGFTDINLHKQSSTSMLNTGFSRINLLSIGIISGLLLLGCQPPSATTDSQSDTANTPDSTITSTNNTSNDIHTVDDKNKAHALAMSDTEAQNISTSLPITIDWSKIDSGVHPIDPDNFTYPFAVDSQPVKAYADFFQVTPAEAQHSLTVGTAGNEPLPALFEQLKEQYISHELTDGKEVRLIIHTTNNVAPSEHVYVFAEPFAHGLSIPIVIEPQS